MNRWGKISFSVLSALAAVACTATVAPVNGPVAPIAPSIATQPTNQTVTAGQTATFTVMANGTAPLTYQWQKNGTNIAGVTRSEERRVGKECRYGWWTNYRKKKKTR